MTNPVLKYDQILSEKHKRNCVPNSLAILLAYKTAAEPFPRRYFTINDAETKFWWEVLNNKETNLEFVQMIKLYSMPCRFCISRTNFF